MIRNINKEKVSSVEVYVKTSLKTVIRRDPKGLYAGALRGKIKHITSIVDPYEPPLVPYIILDTERSKLYEGECVLSF